MSRGKEHRRLCYLTTFSLPSACRISISTADVSEDNAAMESPMGIVKSECVHARVYATRDEAALDIFEYIEAVYNRARIHSALGYMSPAEFEEANWPDDEGRLRAV